MFTTKTRTMRLEKQDSPAIQDVTGIGKPSARAIVSVIDTISTVHSGSDYALVRMKTPGKESPVKQENLFPCAVYEDQSSPCSKAAYVEAAYSILFAIYQIRKDGVVFKDP